MHATLPITNLTFAKKSQGPSSANAYHKPMPTHLATRFPGKKADAHIVMLNIPSR